MQPWFSAPNFNFRCFPMVHFHIPIINFLLRFPNLDEVKVSEIWFLGLNELRNCTFYLLRKRMKNCLTSTKSRWV
jgi:hypothetical protein